MSEKNAIQLPSSAQRLARRSQRLGIEFKKQRIIENAPIVSKELPVATIPDYSLSSKKKEDALFIKRLEEMGRTVDSLPPLNSLMNHIATLDDLERPEWYKGSQSAIVNSQSLLFPNFDLLSRVYLVDFLREAVAKNNERPCSRVRCESFDYEGFRCRELIIPSIEITAHAGFCYICHLFLTHKYHLMISKEFVAHLFCVMVDSDGEYKLSKCIRKGGVYGPVPSYSREFYKKSKTSLGVNCYVESETLIWRK